MKVVTDWVTQILGGKFTLSRIVGDASFRQYFRLHLNGKYYVLMDSHPDYAPIDPFVTITHTLKKAQVKVPDIIAENHENGFILLTDLGDSHYLENLRLGNEKELYELALKTLSKIQSADSSQLPQYDEEQFNDETQLFSAWFLNRHLGIRFSTREKKQFEEVMSRLNSTALDQPKCFVHRDYHSRNLMICDNKAVGVLDYQDAVLGPITYDLASLLRDAYINCPQTLITQLVERFFIDATKKGLVTGSLGRFFRWFDWAGVQRHLKIAGIFCRLHYRDDKPDYLNHIPLTLKYLEEITAGYEELIFIHELFQRYQLHQRLRDANRYISNTL